MRLRAGRKGTDHFRTARREPAAPHDGARRRDGATRDGAAEGGGKT